MIILLNAGLGYILRVFDTNGWLFLTPVAAVVVPTMVPLPPTAYPLVGAVKNLLKSDYPPPKEMAFRPIYGFATSNSLLKTGKAKRSLPPSKTVSF